MHIDDFAFWNNYILTPEEVYYVMNKGKIKGFVYSQSIQFFFKSKENYVMMKILNFLNNVCWGENHCLENVKLSAHFDVNYRIFKEY